MNCSLVVTWAVLVVAHTAENRKTCSASDNAPHNVRRYTGEFLLLCTQTGVGSRGGGDLRGSQPESDFHKCGGQGG